MVDITITHTDGEVTIEYSTDDPTTNVRVLAPATETLSTETLLPIRQVSTESIRDNPYNVRSEWRRHLPELDQEFIKEFGTLHGAPLARRTGEHEYEVVDGHGRVALMEALDMDPLPIHVFNMSDWEAIEYWAKNHFPPADDPGSDVDRAQNYFDDEEQAAAISRLREDWSDERLREIPRLAEAIDRLG